MALFNGDERLSAPEYPRQHDKHTENGEFDFDETVNDSLRGSVNQQPFAQATTGNAYNNPFMGHNLGNENLQKEKEDMDLRGRVLREQLENKGIDPQNQLRIGGNHFNIEDPNKPPYTPFYLMVTGHVQSGTFDD